MKAGKLPPELLSRLLARLPSHPRLLVGPGVGLDAAAIDLGEGRVLVAKADPITFATDEIGRYAVHVNANDVACLGATPLWFLPTVFLPTDAEPALAESIFEQIVSTCAELGVTPVGGHTEVTVGLDRPLVAGAMLGEATSEALVRPDRSRTGDHVLLTKGIAIEGTALVAREAPDRLRASGVNDTTIAAAAHLLREPGISVVRDAQIACRTAQVHALHDPTEGGLATALLELSSATGHELVVRLPDVPTFDETRVCCAALGLDPLGLLASGALLIVVDAAVCETLRSALVPEGIACACIGELARHGAAAIIDQNGHALPMFDRDEVARFFEALGEGEHAGPNARTPG